MSRLSFAISPVGSCIPTRAREVRPLVSFDSEHGSFSDEQKLHWNGHLRSITQPQKSILADAMRSNSLKLCDAVLLAAIFARLRVLYFLLVPFQPPRDGTLLQGEKSPRSESYQFEIVQMSRLCNQDYIVNLM